MWALRARGILLKTPVSKLSPDTLVYDTDTTPVEHQSSINENQYRKGGNPNSTALENASGTKNVFMQEIVERTAGIPSLEADFHDYDPAPPPRIQRGAVASGVGEGAERKNGPSKW